MTSDNPYTHEDPKRIMVVDDEPALSKITRVNLEKLGGYTVCEVNEPLKAIKTAKQFQPDLILMDVVMPILSGGELAEKIRSRPEFKGVPIIFLTSMVSGKEAAGHGLVKGGERFLSKPILREVLLNTVAEALEDKL
jgi:CheY-like chemotaxis protein